MIAFVALIVFGPRKLPGIGRQIGRYTSEFKRASNEFRRNWESEVELAERDEKKQPDHTQTNFFGENRETAANNFDDSPFVENTIGRNSAKQAAKVETGFGISNEKDSIALPEIRRVNQSDFRASAAAAQPEAIKPETETAPRKREWL